MNLKYAMPTASISRRVVFAMSTVLINRQTDSQSSRKAWRYLGKVAAVFLGSLLLLGIMDAPAFALPHAPNSLVAEPSISPSINVSWSEPDTGEPNFYYLYRNLTTITVDNKASSGFIANLNGSINYYTDNSGIVGETYWYAVTAVDDDGEGSLSNSDDATVAGKENPHDSYTSVSNLCRDCHDIHNSLGSTLCFRRETEKEVCYTCHDGTGSDYNIRTGEGGFGELTLGETTRLSYHPVPNTNLELELSLNQMRCCDCHTPHLNPAERPRLLMAGGFDGGDEFCGYCHGSEANWKGINLIGSDHLSYIGDPHGHYLTTAFYTPSQSATKINCVACHAYHGADIRPLIPSTVNANSVIAGEDNFSNNTLCQACHDAAINGSAWGGLTLYNATKHALTEATHANVTWTAGAYENEYQGGYCLNCHNPHGTNYSPSLDTTYLESFADYQKDYQNQLCYDCHVDDKVPASNYSYRGKDPYIASGHGESADDGNVWPTSADTGGGLWTGGAEATQCINCHNPHGRNRGDGTAAFDYLLLRWAWDNPTNKSDEEYLCYGTSTGNSKSSGCHSVAYTYTNAGTGGFYGSDVSLNIWDLFNPGTVYEDGAVASNALINQRHDISCDDQNQYNAGAKIECDDCHNPHINTSDYDLVNGKSRVAIPANQPIDNFIEKYNTINTYTYSGGGTYNYYYAAGDADPTFGQDMPDFVSYCLACHDNPNVPSDVSYGDTGETANIAYTYFIGGGGMGGGLDKHGRGDGSGAGGPMDKGSLKTPYDSANTYASLNCTDCHEPHGSESLYHLKNQVVINGTMMSVAAGSSVVSDGYYGAAYGNIDSGWCTFCHNNVSDHGGGGTKPCSQCHSHGSGNF